MADGDITTITEYGRFAIPGGGHNTAGVAQNNKVMVWGRLVGTYVTTGLDLAGAGGRKVFGVNKLDFLSMDVRYCGATSTTVPTDIKLFLATLEESSDKIFVADEVGTDTPAEPSDGESVTIDFIAVGEDAATPRMV